MAIHLHHVDPGYEPIRQEIVTRLGQDAFVTAITNDVASGSAEQRSLAEDIDAQQHQGLPPYAAYVARTIFMHTLAFNDPLKGLTAEELHRKCLGTKIGAVWPYLGGLDQRYTLIGGTAIALYCGHPESAGVDLSTTGGSEHPRVIRRSIATEIGKHKVLRGRSGVVVKFFATAKTPKIDIHGTDPWKNRHPRRVAANGLHIAAPADLAARKLVAMAERSEPRDGRLRHRRGGAQLHRPGKRRPGTRARRAPADRRNRALAGAKRRGRGRTAAESRRGWDHRAGTSPDRL